MDIFNEEVVKFLEGVFSGDFDEEKGIKRIQEKWREIEKSEKTNEKCMETNRVVEDVIRTHLNKLVKHTNQGKEEEFIKSLLDTFDVFQKCLSTIRDTLKPIEEEIIQVSTDSKSFYEVGLESFAEIFLFSTPSDNKESGSPTISTFDRVVRTILSNIRKERNHEQTDCSTLLLKGVIGMISEISPTEYFSLFEKQLLKETEDFYLDEVKITNTLTLSSIDSENSFIEAYLKRLGEEEDLSRRYLYFDSTFPEIKKLLIQAFFERYPESLTFERLNCESMLSSWKLEPLRKAYDIISHIPGAHEKLQNLIRMKMTEEGRFMEGTVNSWDRRKPLELIEEILVMNDKYEDLLKTCFVDKDGEIDETFERCIDGTFTTLINNNIRIAEYMSLFLDSKLKVGKQTLEESEFDDLLDKLFRGCIMRSRDKDIFMKYYSIHFAKRLMGNKSQSMEMEKSFISRAKMEFGEFDLTSKIEGMLNDFVLMKRYIGETFKMECLENNFKQRFGFDFHPLVLTAGFWPLYCDGHDEKIVLPKQISGAQDFFFDHYKKKTSEDRKLIWFYTMGESCVRMNGFHKPYELVCSTAHMLILLCFNEKKILTLEEIMARTGLEQKVVVRHLRSLCSRNRNFGRILLREKGSKLWKSTKFMASEKFSSARIRNKVTDDISRYRPDPGPVRPPGIDEERKWLLDSKIVNIMKHRKVLMHKHLINEVTRVLRHLFVPSPKIIKIRIESLIEREYLERSPESRKIYVYLA